MTLDTIILGDCLQGMNDIPDESIDLVLTDPPYLFVKGGMKNPNWNNGKMKSDSYMIEEMSDFGKDKIYELCENIKPKFKHGYNAYFFCSELQIVYYLQYAVENKFRYNVLVWDRCGKNMVSKKFFRSNIDYIIRIYGKGNSLNAIDEYSAMDMYSKIRVAKQGEQTNHPTEKPIKVLKDLIMLSSNEGDVVLDPFIGSGTTAIACKKEGRHFIGFEIDENFYNIACRRLEVEDMQLTLF